MTFWLYIVNWSVDLDGFLHRHRATKVDGWLCKRIDDLIEWRLRKIK